MGELSQLNILTHLTGEELHAPFPAWREVAGEELERQESETPSKSSVCWLFYAPDKGHVASVGAPR